MEYPRAHMPAVARALQLMAARARTAACMSGLCIVIAAAMGPWQALASGESPAAVARNDVQATSGRGADSEASTESGDRTQADAARRARAAARRALVRAERSRDRLQQRLGRLELQRDEAIDSLDRVTAVYEDHLVSVYKTGNTARLRELILARDVRDAVDRVDVMLALVDHDRRIVEEHAAAVSAVEDVDDQLDTLADGLVDANVAVDSAQDHLASLTEEAQSSASPRDGVVASAGDYYSTSFSSPLGGLLGDVGSLTGLGLHPAGAGLTNSQRPPDLVPSGRIEEGIASWYGPGFHGKQTANGETYDQFAYTAAHRTLPFGTWVRVTSVTTGASVDVRITDRGPFVAGRIIDLSWIAGQQIGMDGIADVTVEPLEAPASGSDRVDA